MLAPATWCSGRSTRRRRSRALIGDVQAAGLRPGIETSLTRRLENALRALARDNTNAAIGMIGAFVNQVTALRGRQIPEVEADAWIAEAEAILAALAT